MTDSVNGTHIITGTKAASLVIERQHHGRHRHLHVPGAHGAIFRESGAFSLKICMRKAPIIQLATNAVLPPGIVSGSYHDGSWRPVMPCRWTPATTARS